MLLALNAGRRLPEPLTLVYPADGVVTADYPLTQLSSASRSATEALRSLTEYLRRPGIQRNIMARTHRRPVIPEVRPGPEFGAQPPELPFPARPEAVDALIDAYFNRLRRPARTAYVLDTSGSMRGTRLTALKVALAALTGVDNSLSGRFQRFHDREEVTLLPFSSRPGRPTTYVLPASGSAAELAKIRADTEKLVGTGSTAIYESLEKAYSVIGTSSTTDRITSIVLMSDGGNNEGASFADFRSWYERQPLALRRIPVFTVLFGESATDEMNSLAALTHGRTFDARLQSLSSVFGEIRGYQ